MRKIAVVKGKQLNENMYMYPMYLAEDVVLIFEDERGKLTEIKADKLIEYYKEINWNILRR